MVNVLFGTRFTDLCYGYNAFWRQVVPTLDLPDTALPRPADGSKLWGDGFEIETMINIRAAVDGMKVGEVGSVEHARIHGESNLNTFRDGFRVLRTIFSEYGRMRAPAPERPPRRGHRASGARPPRRPPPRRRSLSRLDPSTATPRPPSRTPPTRARPARTSTVARSTRSAPAAPTTSRAAAGPHHRRGLITRPVPSPTILLRSSPTWKPTAPP